MFWCDENILLWTCTTFHDKHRSRLAKLRPSVSMNKISKKKQNKRKKKDHEIMVFGGSLWARELDLCNFLI